MEEEPTLSEPDARMGRAFRRYEYGVEYVRLFAADGCSPPMGTT
jgi:hypothetical protein